MTETLWHELTDTERDALIARVQAAVAHGLSLSVEDRPLLLKGLLSFAHRHERLAESELTRHKLRKLAGIVSASEKLKHIVPGGEQKKPARPKPTLPGKPPSAPLIHERCHPRLVGLSKGQRCPEGERGTLYKYRPAGVAAHRRSEAADPCPAYSGAAAV